MIPVKFTKEQVQFESPAKGMDRCMDCKYFLGGRCKIVYGVVQSNDWCNKWKEDHENSKKRV